MAQTVGTRAGEKHRGDFLVTCAYCGAVWYRSKCRRNAAGQLICPDDQHIRDPVTLARLNAARTSQLRKRRVDGGNIDREALTTSGPLVVCPELVVAGWEGLSGVTLANGGRVAAWTALSGGLTLVKSDPAEQPKLKTDGPSGRSYVSFEGAHILEESTGDFIRPAPSIEPTSYWAVVRQPRWTVAGVWWGFETAAFSATGLAIYNALLAGDIAQFNGYGFGANPMPAPLGQWKRVETSFTGSAADYLTVGATRVALGISSGDDAPTDDFAIGLVGSGSYVYLDVGELWILRGVLSTVQSSLLNDYGRAKYGSQVLL